MKIFVLLRKYYEEYEDNLELFPIISSQDKSKIDNYLDNLLKESEDYDKQLEWHVRECKTIIRNYLLNNYDAITGWRDVREQVGTSYPITNEEKYKVINFLCNNYSYSYGKNIIEVAHNNGFIDKYCDVKKLSKPYPKLPKPPQRPKDYYRRTDFKIEEIEYL